MKRRHVAGWKADEFGSYSGRRAYGWTIVSHSTEWHRKALQNKAIRRSPDIITVIRHSLMGAQAAGEVHRSHGGHYDVYQGGESFDDVIQVELEFLHRHAKKAD